MIKKQGGHLMVDGHCVRTIHAERNAMLQCALDGTSPNGAELYVTASPCWDCAKDILRAGIIKVYFGLSYNSRYGLSDQVGKMLDGAGISIVHLLISPETLYD
jgi:dCMP deaminase